MSPHHEEPPQGGVSNGDFAQDEVNRWWQTEFLLILSEVEGRMMPAPRLFLTYCNALKYSDL